LRFVDALEEANMRHSIILALAAGTIGAMVAFSAPPALAKTIHQCEAEYTARKASLTAAGAKHAHFISSCLAQRKPRSIR
jgi:hypothetical protein